MSEPLLFRQATLPSGEQTDVLVRDGLIVEMGSVTSKDARSVDAAGLQMLPGLVDLHTHL